MAIRVPKGFSLAGVHCRIKRDPHKHDLTLVDVGIAGQRGRACIRRTWSSPPRWRSTAAARPATGFAPW